jgi:hypothetical protein
MTEDYTTDGGINWSEITYLSHNFMPGKLLTDPNDTLAELRITAPLSYFDFGVWNAIYGGDGFYCLVDYF